MDILFNSAKVAEINMYHPISLFAKASSASTAFIRTPMFSSSRLRSAAQQALPSPVSLNASGCINLNRGAIVWGAQVIVSWQYASSSCPSILL